LLAAQIALVMPRTLQLRGELEMRAIGFAVALVLSGCASAPEPLPINPPVAAGLTADRPMPEMEGDVVALAFSGGGARAAAFSLGALHGLRDMRATDGRTLLDHVRLVTAVSGGSIVAAYFGQHGPAGIDGFRAAFLDKEWPLHTSPYSPLNWSRASRGGLNDPTRMADWLDREVFAGGLMRDVWNGQGVRVWVNATDLYNGTTFAFAPIYFSALCSDLGQVRIADAVAASMSVPLAFRPMLAAPYPDRCQPSPAWVANSVADHAAPALVRRTAQAFSTYRDPERQRYLHLVDGGVLDNLGLTSLSLARETAGTPYGPLSPREAVRIRRMVFLVVNAEKARFSTWQLSPQSPGGGAILEALSNIVIESPNRSAYDSFRALVAKWEGDVRTYRCGLSNAEVENMRGAIAGWDCADVHFVVDMVSFADLGPDAAARLGATPTQVSLPSATIDMLISAGRVGVGQSPSVLALTR
jgi:NTE family protein